MKGYCDVNAMCEHASDSNRESVMSVHGGGWVAQRRGMHRQVAVTGSDSRYHWLQTSPAIPQPLYGPVLYQDPEITQVLRGLFDTLRVRHHIIHNLCETLHISFSNYKILHVCKPPND